MSFQKRKHISVELYPNIDPLKLDQSNGQDTHPSFSVAPGRNRHDPHLTRCRY